MILIVGLGNPQEKYRNTRHNIGFLVVDAVAAKNQFAQFQLSKKFHASIAEGVLRQKKLLLVKPQTFMNKSGQAVQALIQFYKPTSPGLVVIHDDIDLPLGTIRIAKDRGSAGHKGVQSIIEALKTKEFVRVRVGISPEKKLTNVDRFVLKKFAGKENVGEVVQKAVEALEILVGAGVEKAMNEYN